LENSETISSDEKDFNNQQTLILLLKFISIIILEPLQTYSERYKLNEQHGTIRRKQHF
jgi:hypothetical protein